MKEMSLCNKNTARNPTGGGKLMITKEKAPTTLTLVEKISKCESINEDLFIDAYMYVSAWVEFFTGVVHRLDCTNG